jgi:short-subunit dehydrogenase
MNEINAHNEIVSRGYAVVTGASAGIGKTYADRLAQRGYNLILVARRGELLEKVAASLRGKHKVEVETIVADLGKPLDLARVAIQISADSRVTMLVNNAGTSTMTAVGKTLSTAADAMTDLNVTALVRLTLAILPGFKARNSGTIINIGSVLGFHSLPISTIYSGTKGYVLNFTRGLQDEVAGTGVAVQLVLPAATATDLWDISGVPLSALDPATVMTVDDMVDAALAGLDLGETITLPSVENASQLLAAYDAARMTLLGAAQTGKAASRYRVAN